ncbi:MAG: glycosyltransferase family 2 protein [Sporomusaceae bacterium]|nr:glycosyltransferase family 2 protein [Sporomusaceae bacterium]
MSELVSIIMPVYNLEKYVCDSILSVQRQTYTDWRLLVIDDGSTDASPAIIAEMAEKDKRIQLLCQQNGGVAKARNTGLDAAKGKYIAFLDGDDIWQPTFLAELLRTNRDADKAMVYCGYRHLYIMGFTTRFSYPYVSGDILVEVIQGRTQVHIGCLLVERAILDRYNIRFTAGCLMGEDQEFIIKLVAVVPVKAVPQELMLYRIRMGSAINSRWDWQKRIHSIWALKRSAAVVLGQKAKSEEYGRLEEVFQQRISYKVLKFFWRMLKNGFHTEAEDLLRGDLAKDLFQLDVPKLKRLDQLKWKLVCSHNQRIWKLVNVLRGIV